MDLDPTRIHGHGPRCPCDHCAWQMRHVDLLPLAIALIDTERECLDAEIDGKRARRARDVAERKRAFEELRTAAARWAKVAPLIEALHQASMIEAGDPMHVVDAAMELLAATQEPTP